MKRQIKLLPILLLLPIGLVKGDEESQLKLSGQIESERYCGLDNELASLLLRFKVSFDNRGDAAVVVYQPFYPRILVSRTLKNLESGRHEFDLRAPTRAPKLVSEGKKETGSISPPLNHIVQSREHYESNTEVGLPVLKTAKHSKIGGLKPGIHYLELVMDFDTVGTDSLVHSISQPIRITVKEPPSVLNCP